MVEIIENSLDHWFSQLI